MRRHAAPITKRFSIFMKKIRHSLIAAAAVCALAASAMAVTTVAAADEYREVTLTGTNVFYAGVSGAKISVTRLEDASAEGGYRDYTLFEMGANQTVTFRKNLAYNWYSSGEDGTVENKKFSMSVGFEDLSFESYTIKFQSQQYSKTEDGVSENCLIFKPSDDGQALELYISESEDISDGQTPSVTLDDYLKVNFSFGDYVGGDYSILVNGEKKGEFVNVRENYASYVSSGSSAATPIIFSAEFAEDAEKSASCGMIMYELNGQSFEVFDARESDGVVSGGVIHDDCAPVVCLNSNLNYLEYGGSIDIDYKVIDVVASSPRSTLSYYVLTAEQFNDVDFDYENTSSDAKLFTEVTTSMDVKLLRDSNTYVPNLDETNQEVERIDGYRTYGLAKVCLLVKDTTASNARQDYVFLDWYVNDSYKLNLSDIEAGKADEDFIRIVEDERGATYGVENGNEITTLEEYKAKIQSIETQYQAAIDAAVAEQYPDGVYAGSSKNFYLPDFSGYITDNLGGYTDLTYRIYYRASATSSTSSLAYNNLALPLTEAGVTYRFTIFATDEAGNEMYYPTDEAGYLEHKSITTDDIWDDDFSELLPFFEITVSYKSATVETPGVQSIGYVGSAYNDISFEIDGVSGTYTTTYYLYILNRDAMFDETGIDLTYDEVIENIDALFFNTYRSGVNTRQYFTAVRAASSLTEGDADYDKFADYAWDPNNVTFVPQSPSEFYVVRLVLKDTGLSNASTDSFLVVRASARANSIYGEDNWLSNNIASIVLFCVAGVCFIALVVLIIVKPKDKGDIDKIEVAEPKKKSKKIK